MIRRHVLAALAIGVEAGDDEAARSALENIEWVLRGPARRRLEKALLDAALATGTNDFEDKEAVRHWLRAASLCVRAEPDAATLADRARDAAAYAQAAVQAPMRFPLATVIAAMLAAGSATAFGAATVLAIKAPVGEDSYRRPTPPPPVGVFRDGGAPRSDRAIEYVLKVDLPKLVAMSELSRKGPVDHGARDQMVQILRDDTAFAAHGPNLAIAWQRMLGSYERWMVMVPGDRDYARVSRELRARFDVVSDQLAAVELGYYIDPEIVGEPHPRRRAGIYAYRIERVSFVRANDREPIRVFEARRLDPADAGAAILGMKQDELDDPIVLLDSVEHKVATQILPVLAGATFPIGDDNWVYTTRGRDIAAAAAYGIRRELLAALYTAAQNPEQAAIKTRELITASVRHHEAQHKLDHDVALPYPSELSTRLGDKKNDPFAIRTRYELSAYLSQIASDVWLPQLTLWNLARHGFHKGKRREETFVAVVVIEGLARKLGVAQVGPVIRNGEVDRDRLALLAEPLAQRTTAELRGAAAELWTEMFGEKLVRLYD
ncbi:MAG: hypothetical protein ACKV2T_19350 [Kofleriaceae bacterium]